MRFRTEEREWGAGADFSQLHRIGNRLVSAGVLSVRQRDLVLEAQEKLKETGRWVRFGDLAIQVGYCTKEQVESLPGYIGTLLVAAGVISEEQRQLLVAWQEKLRLKGRNVRFGDLAVSEGLCSESEISMLLEQQQMARH